MIKAISQYSDTPRTGRYRIIVHDRRTELPDSPVRSHPWGDCLRRYAMLNGIPLLILHGEDSDAPLLPGVPRNVRQYWQCPECAKLYYEEHRANAEKQSRVLNVLLFPINVVPDMVAGMCIFTGAAIYAIFTSDEFGWFAVALPSMPFAGAIFGIGCAWYGLPFWNVRLPEM